MMVLRKKEQKLFPSVMTKYSPVSFVIIVKLLGGPSPTLVNAVS